MVHFGCLKTIKGRCPLVDSVVFPVLFGTLIFGLLVGFLILFILLYKRSQLKFELERQAFKQEQLETQIEIREQTLNDVSRDLHDNLGQLASLVKINLSMMSPEDAATKERISETKELLQQLIDDLRSLSVSLNGENLSKLGLVGMIRRDIARIQHSGYLETQVELMEDLGPLEETKLVFLYRIFQELVNNVLKHSQATQLVVKLYHQNSQLKLEVSDNGTGFSSKVTKGSGLNNIDKRCSMIGAKYSVQSDQGTHIEVILPMKL